MKSLSSNKFVQEVKKILEAAGYAKTDYEIESDRRSQCARVLLRTRGTVRCPSYEFTLVEGKSTTFHNFRSQFRRWVHSHHS